MSLGADGVVLGNDYGESSYICDTDPRQIVEGAGNYVQGFDHAAYRAVLPSLIAAYKAGNAALPVPHAPRAIAWYRTTPARCAGDGGACTTLASLLKHHFLNLLIFLHFNELTCH